MKKIAFLFLTFTSIVISSAQDLSSDIGMGSVIEKRINSQWTFNYFPETNADQGYETPGFNDSKWPAISLPHTWLNYETTGLLYPFINDVEDSDNLYWFTGWGWYRKHFIVSDRYYGKKVFVKFDSVQKRCKLYVNGKLIGEHKGNDGHFYFDISGHVRTGKDNLLAVAVSNSQDYASISELSGRDSYELFGGITGDVTILIKNNLYFPFKGISSDEQGMIVSTPLVTKKQAVVKVETMVKNDNPQKKSCALQSTITDKTGKVVQVIKTEADINPGQLFKFDQTFKPLKKPHLWSLEDPYSYNVSSELIDGKDVVDRISCTSGLKFSVTGEIKVATVKSPIRSSLEEVFLFSMNKRPSAIHKKTQTGEPVRIILKSSAQMIDADRGSLVKITTDIVDEQGNSVSDLRKTIKWIITGPAILAGPVVYNIDNSVDSQTGDIWSGSIPFINAIRSSGKPGIIKVTAYSTGLASGSVDIVANEIKYDNTVITEPLLDDMGRKAVARLIITSNRLVDPPEEMLKIADDMNFGISDRKGYASIISDLLLRNSTLADSASPEFKTVTGLFDSYLLYNGGKLKAEDYNYTIEHYNNFRLISGYINSTKLPQLFKETLKKYYINSIIEEGNEKNAGEEMNWLNWIPSGGIVVVSADKNTGSYPKETIVTAYADLNDLIALVYPVYRNFSAEARERALTFIGKMNPYVRQTFVMEKDDEGKSYQKILYSAQKEQPILIPLLKFIAE